MSKRCILCGCELGEVHINTLYCRECKHQRDLQIQRSYQRRVRAARKAGLEQMPTKPKQKPPMTIEQIAQAAREAGMTYGQYVAQL